MKYFFPLSISFLDHDDIFLRFFVNVVWTKKSEQRYFLFFLNRDY